MSRIGLTVLVLAAAALGFASPSQAVSCTYDQCITACSKLGGGHRSGGCPAYCQKALRERKASGICK